MNKLTNEQAAAVESRGKVIVSASAGSGKTFVMIQKLVGAICGGADLDEILAVTFTKKAASQMKEKLRAAIIKKLETASAEEKVRLKSQLSKIGSANISTIHAFCGKLLRTYFYALDIDSGFDIISSDDATARDLKKRALDSVFERGYASDATRRCVKRWTKLTARCAAWLAIKRCLKTVRHCTPTRGSTRCAKSFLKSAKTRLTA